MFINYALANRCSVVFLLGLLLALNNPLSAQNGVYVGPTAGTADPSAMLDVVSPSKGFLMPRVDLDDLLNANSLPIPNPSTGLLVYNLGGGNITAVGLYYWDGGSWVQLSAGALSGSGTTNTVAKWTSSSAVGNSQITDDGTDVAVASLAGTGNRPVVSGSTGILRNPIYFNCTGADQTWTCPVGVTSITVKMWGAGGGSGSTGGWKCGFVGGGGGYSTGTIAVTAGSTYYIMVGRGGQSGDVSQTFFSYGGGGRACTSNDCRYSGAGGGRSAFRNTANTTDLMTAGGGGGGGVIDGNYGNQLHRGGAGGGIDGQDGENQYNGVAYAGRGGHQGSGGAGGAGNSRQGSVGTQYQGGYVSGSESYGGGGGGGWYGGGGGSYHTFMSGGGGGSGYIGGAGVSAATTTAGNREFPAGVNDPNYQAGVGCGGMGSGGGHGLVVIIPN